MCFGKKANKVYELPKTYKAISLVERGQPLQVQSQNMPILQEEGDLLIQVEAAGVNLIDFYNVMGIVPVQQGLPVTPGEEGSGIVVSGKGDEAEQLVGKRVSFIRKITSQHGSYGQYSVSTTQLAMEVPMSVTFEQAALGSINPITVVGLYKKAKKFGAKAVVNTAAGGSLGQSIQRFFRNQGVQVINIVRRQEQLEQLKKQNVPYVLNSTSNNFAEDFKKLTNQLQANVALDAVCGDLAQQILNSMPRGSTLICYDGLSQVQEFKVNLVNLLNEKKTITGYSIHDDYYELGPKEMKDQQIMIPQKLNSDFKTTIGKTFNYDEINDVFNYYLQNMSKGKNIIKFKN